MALAIRLTRGGAKKRPYYRIVVADSRAPRDGRFIEKLGSYNALLAKDSPERVKLDADRISHWLPGGAPPSPTDISDRDCQPTSDAHFDLDARVALAERHDAILSAFAVANVHHGCAMLCEPPSLQFEPVLLLM